MKTTIFLVVITLLTSTEMIGQSSKVVEQNISLVKFGRKANSFLGSFVQIEGSKIWGEVGKKEGIIRSQFVETHRDDRSIYLVDHYRGVKIQLDLQAKKVLYGDRHNPQMQPLYRITQSYSEIFWIEDFKCTGSKGKIVGLK